MKKVKLFLVSFLLITSYALNAQVAVNKDGTAADGSAMLDVKATDAGFLMPRMTEAEMNAIPSPATGLVVFCTDLSCLSINLGTPGTPDWQCVGNTKSDVTVSDPGVYSGTYVDGVAFSGNTITFTVTNNGLTVVGPVDFNNSSSIGSGTATFSPAAGTYASADYSTVTLNPGSLKDLVYNITGTPTSTGTLIVDFNGPGGLSSSGTETIQPNQAPVASNVDFSGSLYVGGWVTGTYAYNDSEGDLEGTSTFQWYQADDALGTNQMAISGATSDLYNLQAGDLGKYVAFEVTPIAQTGTATGAAVMSAYQGAVAAAPPINILRGGPASANPVAIPVQITSANGATPYTSDLNSWTGNWRAPQATYDQGTYVDDPDNWSTDLGTAQGSTWSGATSGGYGILIVDMQQWRTISNISVFQMFSDGKTTHIAFAAHSETGSTPPDAFDTGWTVFLPKSPVGAGTNNSGYVSDPTKFSVSANTRYVKIMAWNDGTQGSASYIELKGVKMFAY